MRSRGSLSKKSAASLVTGTCGLGRRAAPRASLLWGGVSGRDADVACAFLTDVAGRPPNRVQVSTDGHAARLCAVDPAFSYSPRVDYAQLVKIYGTSPEAGKRYSAPIGLGGQKSEIHGMPAPEHASTSYVERQNLSMRMDMRALDQRVLKEARKPHARACDLLHALQFCAHPSNAQG